MINEVYRFGHRHNSGDQRELIYLRSFDVRKNLPTFYGFVRENSRKPMNLFRKMITVHDTYKLQYTQKVQRGKKNPRTS